LIRGRGVLSPSPYQVALIQSFDKAQKRLPKEPIGPKVIAMLLGAGVTAALLFLLKMALESDDKETPSTKPKGRRPS
jgi:hypothetical protein